MEVISNSDTEGVITVVVVDTDKILAGCGKGEIKLWRLNQSPSKRLELLKTYSGNSDPVLDIVLLSNQRFLSFDGEGNFRLWHLDHSYELKTIENAKRSFYSVMTIVSLPNDLIAMLGYSCMSQGGFTIWDIEREEEIYDHGYKIWRPEGFAAGVAKGFLIVHSYCRGDLQVWKVNHEECTEIENEIDDQRIYSMAITPLDVIITCGHQVNFFKIDGDGNVEQFLTMDNWNVIDEVIPINEHVFLTIDRGRFCAGVRKLRNYILGDYEDLGNSFNICNHVYVPKHNLILAIGDGKFHVTANKNLDKVSREAAEIRKIARALSQYKNESFLKLPRELVYYILDFMGFEIAKKKVEQIFSDHFCRPKVLTCIKNSK